jgi:hypothetical protein
MAANMIKRATRCGIESKKAGVSETTPLLKKIDERVNTFFVRSLQLDAVTLALEYE